MDVVVSDSASLTSDRVVIDAGSLWQHFDRQAEVLRGESRAHLDRRRRWAMAIDNLVLTPLALAFGSRAGAGGGIVVYLAFMLAYCFICEALTGQTIGKRVTGLRVVRLDGRPLNLSAVAARSLLLLIDMQVACLVGYLVMRVSGRRQRLGDLIAGTVVTEADAFPHRPAHERLRGAIVAGYPLLWLAGAIFAATAAAHQDADARYLVAVGATCVQAKAAPPGGGLDHRAMAALELEAALADVPPPPARAALHQRLLAYQHGRYRELERAARDVRRSGDREDAGVRIRARMARDHARAAAPLRGHGFDACL